MALHPHHELSYTYAHAYIHMGGQCQWPSTLIMSQRAEFMSD